MRKRGARLLASFFNIALIDCDNYQTHVQLIQFTNRKVVLVIFTKEQKSEVRWGEVRFWGH